jgi:uncharacterized repeat protein (TIGR01451 family)
MATFTNQATLSYNGVTVTSNVAVGELVEVLSITKTAVMGDYVAGDDVTFVISIVNAGATPYSNLTVTDDMGGYAFGAGTLYPMDYQAGSVQYFANGVLQAAPTVTAGPPMQFTGISVPANGNITLIYEAQVNEFAPLAAGATIESAAEVTGGGLANPVSDTAIITAENVPNLTISKTISPTTVTENGQVTYTFLIQNWGNTAAVDTDLVQITDTFDPILDPITVTFNGAAWADPANYSYDNTTGLFQSVAGEITVPAATFTQDPINGNFTTNPGVSTLIVTGTI